MFETLECTNSFKIASNDSFQRAIGIKSMKNFWAGQIWAKGAPKLSFLTFSQVWFINFA